MSSSVSSRHTFDITEEVLSLASAPVGNRGRSSRNGSKHTKGKRGYRKGKRGRRPASRANDEANTYIASLLSNDTPKPASTAGLKDEGRVRVCVRCRPPFREEIDSTVDMDSQLVVGIPPSKQTVQLFLDNKSKRREFFFDQAFAPTASQDTVYNTVAGPVVTNALNGFNGTVLAYGQTGTGKTYTMGILNRVVDEHAGLIPRAIGHIFGHILDNQDKDWEVSLSFIQIYLETVQDLFAPETFTQESGNLAVREDPRHGFYVENLHEYVVHNFAEAVELLNWGLDNRVMGCTKMNATSSRSHTVLTAAIKQKGKNPETGVVTTKRGKLLFVDLAGSERIRRTTSTGARMEEAKSINSSLSALGNVIAALSDPSAQHVPFRDSKLTRLLQDSLGGKANTYLIATVGPAAINESETLSTLLFAARCMRVASNPVVNEEVDYAELCASLQMKLAGAEKEMIQREAKLTDQYEESIRQLHIQLRSAQREADERAAGAADYKPSADASHLALSGTGFIPVNTGDDAQYRQALEQCYTVLCDIYRKSVGPICDNMARYARSTREWKDAQLADDEAEAERTATENGMAEHDDPELREGTPHHVARLSQAVARRRVGDKHDNSRRIVGSSSDEAKRAGPPSPGGSAVSDVELAALLHGESEGRDMSVPLPAWPLPPVATPNVDHPPISAFVDTGALAAYITQLHTTVLTNLNHMNELLELKDIHFNRVKEDLVKQLTSRRRQQEVISSSKAILEFLLAKNTDLRSQLKQRDAEAAHAASSTSFTTAAPGVASYYSGTPGVGAGAGSGDSAMTPRPPAVQRIVDRQRATQRPQATTTPLARRSMPLTKLAARRVMNSPDPARRRAAAADSEQAVSYPASTSTLPGAGMFAQRSVEAVAPIEPPQPMTAPAPEPTPVVPPPAPEDSEGDEQEDDDDESDADEIEAVLASKYYEGQLMYKVRWEGGDESSDEWFPRSQLAEVFPDKLDEFEREQRKQLAETAARQRQAEAAEAAARARVPTPGADEGVAETKQSAPPTPASAGPSLTTMTPSTVNHLAESSTLAAGSQVDATGFFDDLNNSDFDDEDLEDGYSQLDDAESVLSAVNAVHIA